MNAILERGSNFIWENARLLERAIFDYRFLGGPVDRIRLILRLHQNADGGFGHALEPDLRSPDSQPLFIEFGLRTLYECDIRDDEMAYQVCSFLEHHADLEHGIPLVFPSSLHYPHAGHMDNPGSQQPSMDRLVGLVGLLNWQGISQLWLSKAVEVCLQKIGSTKFEDAHTILTSFCLIESVSQARPVEALFEKLSHELMRANFFCLEVPITSYGLTPLNFAPSPKSFCRRIFTDSLIEAHLDELLSQQQADGGWPIQWDPPCQMARCEWRAQRTVSALETLRAYGRI
jgi:hypothetical protein